LHRFTASIYNNSRFHRRGNGLRLEEWSLRAPAIAEIFHALQNRDLTARLPELKRPVLIMNGEFDNSLRRSREMSQKIAGAEHRVIAGAGHACCLEDPAAFDEIVLAFLRKHEFLRS
jgi:pimeloyl-ACP methyl ester carboxylesterase